MKITAEEETSTEETTSEEIEITGSVIKEMTVQQIADAYHVPVDKLISILETDYGIKAEPNELLSDVAEKNGLANSEFKDILAEAIQKAKGG
ncbi:MULTISPECIES: hypothetical protein [unclassified Thermococcus]|uniref:hypothetical protein n=1 Tax=unclassified Thermococcus TaxID=2627626 RepID=UPI001F1171DD|nr:MULTISPECIES: hypothetical protein [unclassified Thermococcus]